MFLQGEIFCGAIFMQQLLGWNLYLCVVIILAIVAIYTVVGKEEFLTFAHIRYCMSQCFKH